MNKDDFVNFVPDLSKSLEQLKRECKERALQGVRDWESEQEREAQAKKYKHLRVVK